MQMGSRRLTHSGASLSRPSRHSPSHSSLTHSPHRVTPTHAHPNTQTQSPLLPTSPPPHVGTTQASDSAGGHRPSFVLQLRDGAVSLTPTRHAANTLSGSPDNEAGAAAGAPSSGEPQRVPGPRSSAGGPTVLDHVAVGLSAMHAVGDSLQRSGRLSKPGPAILQSPPSMAHRGSPSIASLRGLRAGSSRLSPSAVAQALAQAAATSHAPEGPRSLRPQASQRVSRLSPGVSRNSAHTHARVRTHVCYACQSSYVHMHMMW